MLLLPLVYGVLTAANEFNVLPDDVKRIIQADTLHLYKFQHSPIAPILNLTATNAYFPTLMFDVVTWEKKVFGYVSDLGIEYTLPMGKYLTLYEMRPRLIELGLQVMENNCQDVGIYYFDGGDAQVLPVLDGMPGFPLIQSNERITVTYQLDEVLIQTDGRQVFLYIPTDCKLGIYYIRLLENIVQGETEENLAGSNRSVVI